MIYGFENAVSEPGAVPTTAAVTEVLRNIKEYPGQVGTLTALPNGHFDSSASIAKIENVKMVTVE